MLQPVKINEFHYREGTYAAGGKKYMTADIIEAAEDIEEFDLPLCGIDIGYDPWGMTSMADFIYHCKRVRAADFDHPIILDIEGSICDGMHRIAKAILAGETTIKAKRLRVMPACVDTDSK
ncbi:MAG: hypothetical protein COA79_25940 [Planctomycetota bacterium]|nr:MAG: hypothetical protein COA79_25940 [Planctomycetota bacterium]